LQIVVLQLHVLILIDAKFPFLDYVLLVYAPRQASSKVKSRRCRKRKVAVVSKGIDVVPVVEIFDLVIVIAIDLLVKAVRLSFFKGQPPVLLIIAATD